MYRYQATGFTCFFSRRSWSWLHAVSNWSKVAHAVDLRCVCWRVFHHVECWHAVIRKFPIFSEKIRHVEGENNRIISYCNGINILNREANVHDIHGDYTIRLQNNHSIWSYFFYSCFPIRCSNCFRYVTFIWVIYRRLDSKRDIFLVRIRCFFSL